MPILGLVIIVGFFAPFGNAAPNSHIKDMEEIPDLEEGDIIPPSGNEAPSARIKDMEEIPGLEEGDMILPPRLKNGLLGKIYKWPKATVVYTLDPLFTPTEVKKILKGWKEIESKTCIKFRIRASTDFDYVFVRKGSKRSGCFSSVGKRKGQQILNYESKCLDRHGTVIHEMLHTIGFYHEQSRPDRDKFVTIVWDKISSGMEKNFKKFTTSEVTTYGAPYDYESVLHYTATGFSIDNSSTIIPKIPKVYIGQRVKLSQLDAGKVRLMYSCPN